MDYRLGRDMNITVKQLIEFLGQYPENYEAVLSNGESIVHISTTENETVILSSAKPIGYCTKCGGYVYLESAVTEYEGYCPSCNENMYSFEYEPVDKEI